MNRKKKENFPFLGNFNVLCYNDKDIFYYQGAVTSFESSTDYMEDYFTNANGATTRIRSPYNILTISTSGLDKLYDIKLDDTTMKRIAKFNKEIECARLDEQIKEKEEKIKELDDLLKDKEKRWDKVKKYIAEIYSIPIDDEYEDEYYDY